MLIFKFCGPAGISEKTIQVFKMIFFNRENTKKMYGIETALKSIVLAKCTTIMGADDNGVHYQYIENIVYIWRQLLPLGKLRKYFMLRINLYHLFLESNNSM